VPSVAVDPVFETTVAADVDVAMLQLLPENTLTDLRKQSFSPSLSLSYVDQGRSQECIFIVIDSLFLLTVFKGGVLYR